MRSRPRSCGPRATAQARILEAQGEAQAIPQVFEAIHAGNPDQKLLAYQYLQMLPKIARGDSNKLWIVPSELTEALKGIGNALGGTSQAAQPAEEEEPWVDTGEALTTAFDDTILEDPARALAEARDEAARSSAEAEGHSAGVSGRGAPRPARATQGDGGPVDPPAPLVDPPAPQAAPPVPPQGLPVDGAVQDDPEGPARS